MQRERTPAQTNQSHGPEGAAPTRLRGFWLVLVRSVWVVLAGLDLFAFIASFPQEVRSLYTPCISESCTTLQLSASQAHALEHFGIPLEVYATFFVAFNVISAGVALAVVEYFLPDVPFNPFNLPLQFLYFLLFLTFASFLSVQIYRYRRVSHPVQRQQSKLVVLAASVVYTASCVDLVSNGLLPLYFPALALPDLAAQLSFELFHFVFPVLIPLAFGLAILRYRLWYIDLLINRTVVYGVLTATLALIYFGLIFGLQFFTRGLLGQAWDHPVLIVGSTLVIAALFHPLRRRLQQVIDRRFYRRKYDAARTVEAFSGTLRQTVDLNELCDQLEAVVAETMQPTFVSLWLRPTEVANNHQAWAPPMVVSQQEKK